LLHLQYLFHCTQLIVYSYIYIVFTLVFKLRLILWYSKQHFYRLTMYEMRLKSDRTNIQFL
jgi:hypothetical protein